MSRTGISRGQKADLQMLGEASDAEWLLDWKNYIMGGYKVILEIGVVVAPL